ncbi:MAG: class I SAM-dependent methyltransferase [Fibrobacterota bacterium]
MIDLMYRVLRNNVEFESFRKVIGRKKEFSTFRHFSKIVDIYSSHVPLKDNVVLELGAGVQLYTAFCILALGAKKVYLSDPSIEMDLIERSDLVSIAKVVKKKYPRSESRINDISQHPDKYIVIFPLNLSEREKGIENYQNTFDTIVSHQVLEHIPSIDTLFNNLVTISKATTIHSHIVDASDHYYHVFERIKPIKSFILKYYRQKHLAYSNKMFAKINGHSCYMNRKLLPHYLETLKKYNINNYSYKILESNFFDNRKYVHKDILRMINLKAYSDAQINAVAFHLIINKQN